MSKLKELGGSNTPAETSDVMKVSECVGKGIAMKILAAVGDHNTRYSNYIFGSSISV